MVVVPGSASLLWELPHDENKRVRRLTVQRQGRSPIPPILHREVADDRLRSTRSNTKRQRHHTHVEALLLKTVTVPIRPFVDHARFLVLEVLRLKAMSTLAWRSEQIIYGWDDSLFRAVFGALGPTSPFTVMKPHAHAAVNMTGGWAGPHPYQLQIMCTPSSRLCDWCSFDQFQNSADFLLMGSCLKRRSMRFVLELVATFSCSSSRMIGHQTMVKLFVSVGLVTSDGTVLLPIARSEHDWLPKVVLTDSAKNRALKLYDVAQNIMQS